MTQIRDIEQKATGSKYFRDQNRNKDAPDYLFNAKEESQSLARTIIYDLDLPNQTSVQYIFLTVFKDGDIHYFRRNNTEIDKSDKFYFDSSGATH